MIAFKRDTSGLYLAEIPANARVVFLFPGSVAHRPDLRSDRPGLDRSWPAWLHRLLRAVGNTRLGRFRGRRPQGLRCQCRHADRLVPRAAEHRAGPGLDHRTRYVVTNRCGILLADIPAKRDVPGPAGFVRTVDDGAVRGRVQQSADRQQPAGATVTFQSKAPFTSLALSGPFAGTASTAFELATADLVQFEAGMMYFSPPVDGGLVNALSYPVFRGAGGSTTPFGFNVTLDVLGPLDAARSFFQFTDPLVGSTFVTTNGKPFALATVNTGDIVTASRLIFRPAAAVAERTALLLSDAGGTVRPGARHQHQQGHDIRNRADAVRRHRHRVHHRQCRLDTGQTRVRAGPAGVSHPACARFANQSRLSRRHRDNLVGAACLRARHFTYRSRSARRSTSSRTVRPRCLPARRWTYCGCQVVIPMRSQGS